MGPLILAVCAVVAVLTLSGGIGDAGRFRPGQVMEPPPWVPRFMRPRRRPARWWRDISSRARFAAAAALFTVAYGAVRWPVATAAAGVGVLAVLAVFLRLRWQARRHRERVVRPLASALAELLDLADLDDYGRRWLSVPRHPEDSDAVVRLRLPLRWHANEPQRAAVHGLISRRLPGQWESSFDLAGFRATFTHPPAPPSRVVYDPGVSTVEHVVPVGQGSRGEWVKINLQDETPHVLVSAPTGWAKTTTLSVIIAHVASYGAEVTILDPKRVGFLAAFADVPGITIHTDIAAMVRAIGDFRASMAARYATVEAGGEINDRRRFPTRVLVLDEMGSLSTMVKTEWRRAGGKGMPEALENIAYLLWQGRFARHYVITGAQQANLDVLISSDMRDQYGARIAAGPQSVSSYRMMYGYGPMVRAPKRKGAAVIGTGGDLRIVQLAMLTEPDARALALRGVEARSARPEVSDDPAPPASAAGIADLDSDSETPSTVAPAGESAPERPALAALPADLVIGIGAAARLLDMGEAAFSKARYRRPIEGELRVGVTPAWPRAALLTWHSRRPIAGARAPVTPPDRAGVAGRG